jgi:DNA processing protein
VGDGRGSFVQDAQWSAWLRLLLTPGVGSGTARKLLSAFGEPLAVFGQTAQALSAVIGAEKAQTLLLTPENLAQQVDLTRRWLEQPDPTLATRCLITLGDPLYPPSLLNIEDPPIVLYAQIGQRWARHSPQWLAQALCAQTIAVVGSRNPTAQGVTNAHAFARELGKAGWSIVSGLALGIDGAAHEGALEQASELSIHVPTIAVVGTGLDRVYPKQHHTLAREIAQHGIMLSEYHLGTPPRPIHFPRRNRIIAGLSQGTLVVEAALQSGSLITARVTAEQGKEVFAIPGSIHSTQSHGCHALIKQGAKLVETAQDILDDMPTHLTRRALTEQAQAESGHNSHESTAELEPALLRDLGFDPVSLDALQARCGLPTDQLQAQLLELELAGQVARLPSGLLQRTAAA